MTAARSFLHFGALCVDVESLQREPPDNFRGADGCCCLCWRKVGRSPARIVGCNGGTWFLAPLAEADRLEREDAGYMGSFTVGRECVKRIEAAIRELGLNPKDYIGGRE